MKSVAAPVASGKAGRSILEIETPPSDHAPPGEILPFDTSERPSSWVYFIQVRQDGPIRIGSTINLARCVEQAQFNNHEPVRLIGAMPGRFEELGMLERRFADSRMHGQWYRPAPHLVAAARMLGVPRLDDGLCRPAACAYCAGHSPESVRGIVDNRTRDYAYSDIGPHRRRMALHDVQRGVLAKDAPPTWTDHEGRTWQTSRDSAPLGASERGRMLRTTILLRDKGRCQWCRSTADVCVDHVITRAIGGANHPDNLRVLCCSCNSVKAGVVDIVAIREKRDAMTSAAEVK